MFVDHFPAPFARFFDLVFRTVLAKLLEHCKFKNITKSLNLQKKNICILCLNSKLAYLLNQKFKWNIFVDFQTLCTTYFDGDCCVAMLFA